MNGALPTPPDSDFDMDVHLRIPVHLWKRLDTLAARHRVTVGALAGEIVRRVLVTGSAAPTDSQRPPLLDDRPLPARSGGPVGYFTRNPTAAARFDELYEKGFTDAAIAELLGCPLWTVRQQRYRLHLPAQKDRP